ncbi:hypothetical protein EGY31_10985 [Burkholderia multivorans]|nr:hypothetical protein EGY31_10985 [Burkholderia multivorans]
MTAGFGDKGHGHRKMHSVRLHVLRGAFRSVGPMRVSDLYRSSSRRESCITSMDLAVRAFGRHDGTRKACRSTSAFAHRQFPT